MNKNDFFDEDFDYHSDELNTSSKRSLKHKKTDNDDDWDDHSDENKRSKRKTRWRDIEDRLSRKELRDNSEWNYDNYDI